MSNLCSIDTIDLTIENTESRANVTMTTLSSNTLYRIKPVKVIIKVAYLFMYGDIFVIMSFKKYEIVELIII